MVPEWSFDFKKGLFHDRKHRNERGPGLSVMDRPAACYFLPRNDKTRARNKVNPILSFWLLAFGHTAQAC